MGCIDMASALASEFEPRHARAAQRVVPAVAVSALALSKQVAVQIVDGNCGSPGWGHCKLGPALCLLALLPWSEESQSLALAPFFHSIISPSHSDRVHICMTRAIDPANACWGEACHPCHALVKVMCNAWMSTALLLTKHNSLIRPHA